MSLPSVPETLLAGVISSAAPCTAPLVPGWLALVLGAGERLNAAVAAYFGAVVAHLVVLGIGSDVLYRLLHRPGGLPGRVGALVVVGAGWLVLTRGRSWLPMALAGLGAGAAFGAAWVPCVGPTLGRLLNPGGGTAPRGVLLAVYGAGLALPFAVLSLGVLAVGPASAWMGRHRLVLARIGAALLGVLAVALASGWFRSVSGHLARFVLGGT